MPRRLLLIFVLFILLLVGRVFAQDITPLEDESLDPAMNITFPPPVYMLSGTTEIRGSANVPNLANYFLEFRPLVVGGEATDAERPWFPASLPVNKSVQDGVLALWNTTTAPDGLYELRLAVNVTGTAPRYFRVSPLRINNAQPLVPSAPTIQAPVRPTLVPTPTALPGSAQGIVTPAATTVQLAGVEPRVIAITNANVRTGDGTVYARIGSLRTDQTAPIIGISSTGSGWFYIRLSNGSEGFVAPSTVRVEGDLSRLKPVVPPPTPIFTPLPTLTPIPTITPTPVAVANLAVVSIVISPAQPVCKGTYQITAKVINNGTGATSSSAAVSAVDRHSGTGTVSASTVGGIPILQPGQTFDSIMFLTVDTFFNDTHTLSISLDTGGQIAETNEGDNSSGISYTLAKGGC